MTYETGSVASLSVEFIDAATNLPADPSAVTLTVVAPDGTSTTYTGAIVHDSIGNFHQLVPVPLSGIYTYRWVGSGTLVAVQEGSITAATTTVPDADVQPLSKLNLCTLDQVKDWLNIQNATVNGTSDDLTLGRMITSASWYWIWATGRGPQDGSIPATSPFVQPVTYSEVYDGNGNNRLYLRNTPIRSVASLTIDGPAIPASTSVSVPGYVIDADGKSIAMRGSAVGMRDWYGGYRRSPYGFSYGIQNVAVTYTAGFAMTPPDITQRCIQMIATTFRRRKWIDQKSISLPEAGGVVMFRDWAIEPDVQRVINQYSRRAIV